MTSYKFATKTTDKQAKAVAVNQNVSSKHSIEIANWLRGKSTTRAKKLLAEVLEFKAAVPFRKFTEVGHRKNIGPGRFPQKASELFIKLIKEVEANASNKGLDDKNLRIAALVVNRGSRDYHHGRQRGRIIKNSHIEIVVEEAKVTKQAKPKAAKAPAQAEAKVEQVEQTEATQQPKKAKKRE